MLLGELRVKCARAQLGSVDVAGSRAVFYHAGRAGVAFVRELKGKTPDRKLRELLDFRRP